MTMPPTFEDLVFHPHCFRKEQGPYHQATIRLSNGYLASVIIVGVFFVFEKGARVLQEDKWKYDVALCLPENKSGPLPFLSIECLVTIPTDLTPNLWASKLTSEEVTEFLRKASELPRPPDYRAEMDAFIDDFFNES